MRAQTSRPDPRKLVSLFTISLLSFGQAYAGPLAEAGKVLELYSVSNVVGSGNTAKDLSFKVKIGGGGLCAGQFIKFQPVVNSPESLTRSFSMLLSAQIAGKDVVVIGAYANSNCDLGSQVLI